MAAIAFPKAAKKVIVLTKQMRKVIKQTLDMHVFGALVVWSGRSRLGKTTTAVEMKRHLDAIYNPNDPDAFCCVHYQVGEIPHWSGQEQKRGIRSMYHACIGRLDEGIYRTYPTEALALLLVQGLRRKNVRMIFIDEAGTLSVDAIRGMVLVRDVAENAGWPLSLIFIGMDDLPVKMTKVQQIENRIRLWCYFEEYPLEDLFEILRSVHPLFAAMRFNDPDHLEMVAFLHEKFGGIPGLVLPFAASVAGRAESLGQALKLTLLKTAYIHSQSSKNSALASVPGYKVDTDEKESESSKPERQQQKGPKTKSAALVPLGGQREKQKA